MLNKYLLSSIFLIFLLSACSERDSIIKPDDCGKHLFQVLKEFDPHDKEKLEKNFISLETIHQIGNDKSLIPNKKRRDRYANMTEQAYQKEIINAAYTIIDNEGYAFSIKWNKIDYVGFVSENQKFSNLESIKGKLVFEYDDKRYDVGCVYIRYDKEWKLAAITGIYLHGVNNPKRPQNPSLIEI
ncbi:MAG: hypothetical protein E6772_04615 [Dysgonomonas sp.]|nr:hypothetical protein [Dysgonomonas sp.]